MVTTHCNQPICLCHLRWLAVALALAGLGARAQADGGPRVLDRVVASVEGQVITASQLDFEARVLLVNAGGVAAATRPLDDETLASSLSALIDLRVATLEADKLDAYPVEPGDLERAVEAFRARFRSEALFREFLGRHEAALDDLRALLRRNLRAQRALDGKLRLKAQVTESEARLHLSRHPELAGTPVEMVRARLFAQRFNELVRDELAQARRQYSVRLLGPFAPRLPAEGPP